jgi:hypothetical protein
MAGRGQSGRPSDSSAQHFTKNASGIFGCNYCDFSMKVFSAKRAKSHLSADDKFAANFVKKCASPPAHVKRQFYNILVAAYDKKAKRKAVGELKEDALKKKHTKSADALRQQQGQQTIAQSLNGSVSKQACDLAVARFYLTWK